MKICQYNISWSVLVSIILIMVNSCNEEFNEYYAVPEQSDQKIWDVIKSKPEYSIFYGLMNEAGFDTILNREQPFTLFIPVNEAFEDVSLEGDELLSTLGYHLSESLILPYHIKTYRKLRTYFGKFTLLERKENDLLMDGIILSNSSILYKNGVYYELQEVVYPKPNLYEFIARTCATLSQYIDLQDSVMFDIQKSTPLGFDDEGNTIYDSVFSIINRFERDYFPVSEEFRDNNATMIIFTQEQYDSALDQMADKLGPMFIDHNDIPTDWQTESLIPYYLKTSVFPGVLKYENFSSGQIRNIQGDTVIIDYMTIDQDSRFICSNGVTFMYNSLKVPENLYIDTLKIEGEALIINRGEGKFAWIEEVKSNDFSREPFHVESIYTSGGGYLSVALPRGYTGSYYFEFIFPRIFPNTYRFIWRANYRPSGIIEFYINDISIGKFDNYKFRNPVDGVNPDNGFNQKVFQVSHLTEYGNLKIRIEYTGPGTGTTNGVNLDYIMLLPVLNE